MNGQMENSPKGLADGTDALKSQAAGLHKQVMKIELHKVITEGDGPTSEKHMAKIFPASDCCCGYRRIRLDLRS